MDDLVKPQKFEPPMSVAFAMVLLINSLDSGAIKMGLKVEITSVSDRDGLVAEIW
jgi:hypothetical protein